jgi:hypothetical protein
VRQKSLGKLAFATARLNRASDFGRLTETEHRKIKLARKPPILNKVDIPFIEIG